MSDYDFEAEMKAKYPKIFDPNAKYGAEISTREGWNTIVESACQLCDKYTADGHQIYVEQVKEKFGQLRFYVSFVPGTSTEVIKKFYDELLPYEQEANETCEFCGSKTDVSNQGFSWLKTLCEDCHKTRETKNPR